MDPSPAVDSACPPQCLTQFCVPASVTRLRGQTQSTPPSKAGRKGLLVLVCYLSERAALRCTLNHSPSACLAERPRHARTTAAPATRSPYRRPSSSEASPKRTEWSRERA
eukprot:6219243-Prymnesium_polylepis.5